MLCRDLHHPGVGRDLSKWRTKKMHLKIKSLVQKAPCKSSITKVPMDGMAYVMS